MCTDTPQRYLRRILVSDFKQTKRWPIIPSLRRCQCSPPPAYLSMCTDTPQRYLRRILILDFKQKNAGRPFSFQNRFSLLWQPCYLRATGTKVRSKGPMSRRFFHSCLVGSVYTVAIPLLSATARVGPGNLGLVKLRREYSTAANMEMIKKITRKAPKTTRTHH